MRPAAAYPGLVLILLLWMPWGRWTEAGFALHMVRHMGLVALAAPLLVIGIPRLAAPLGVPPLAAAVFEFVVVWGWHLPQAHALARISAAGLAVEQASLLLAGLLVWAACLRAPPLSGALGLLLTSMHMTLLGALLVLASRDLYAGHHGAPADLAAQQVGGLVMLGIGTPVYLIGGLALVRRVLSAEESVGT